jgi:hypothetical protein
MRRALAIALMCVLGLPLFASLLGRTGDTALPVCCRRAGVHHCMEMGSSEVVAGRASLRMTCPAFPRLAAAVHTGVWSFDREPALSAQVVVQPAMVGQVEAGYRIASGRARQKRGPPNWTS